MLRHGKYKKDQIKHLEVKNIISEMQNTQDGVKSTLDATGKRKSSELENLAIETIQNKTYKK